MSRFPTFHFPGFFSFGVGLGVPRKDEYGKCRQQEREGHSSGPPRGLCATLQVCTGTAQRAAAPTLSDGDPHLGRCGRHATHARAYPRHQASERCGPAVHKRGRRTSPGRVSQHGAVPHLRPWHRSVLLSGVDQNFLLGASAAFLIQLDGTVIFEGTPAEAESKMVPHAALLISPYFFWGAGRSTLPDCRYDTTPRVIRRLLFLSQRILNLPFVLACPAKSTFLLFGH